MKKLLITILGLFFVTAQLPAYYQANGETTDFERNMIEGDDEDGGPFRFDLNYNAYGRTKFDKKKFRHEHFTYSDFNIQGTMIVHYNKCYKEGISLTLGYDRTFLNWKKNRYFHQHKFNTATFSVQGFTKRACDWLWIASAGINIDTDHFDINQYATYDFLLWGRYDYSTCPDVGVHVGFLAQTGMKIDRVYPILGFDWKINEKFKLNAVFPVNISAVYHYDCNWSFELAARTIDSRHRVGNHNRYKKGIFEYRAVGAELGANYEYDNWLEVNLHAGVLLGGMLKITNQRHKHAHHLNIEGGAPYAGGEVQVNF